MPPNMSIPSARGGGSSAAAAGAAGAAVGISIDMRGGGANSP